MNVEGGQPSKYWRIGNKLDRVFHHSYDRHINQIKRDLVGVDNMADCLSILLSSIKNDHQKLYTAKSFHEEFPDVTGPVIRELESEQ